MDVISTSLGRRNPRLRSRPTRVSKNEQLQRHRELRDHGSNADLLVQSQAWFLFHYLALLSCMWSGREDSNLQPPASEAGALPLRHVQVGLRTDGRIRTDTDGGLSAGPLPVGLRQLGRLGGPRGNRTRNLLLARELRYRLRHRPIGRGSGNRTRVQGV